MKIIFLSGFHRKSNSFQIRLSSLIVVAVVFATLLSGSLLWAGYHWGKPSYKGLGPQERTAFSIQTIFDRERNKLEGLRDRTQEYLDALSLRVGKLQAHVVRLDALGERLAEAGNLDTGEFDFSAEPPLGGTSAADGFQRGQTVTGLLADLKRFTKLLEDRERKLSMLEELAVKHELHKKTIPAGRPVKGGWVSSYFGQRRDPFTGKKAMHKGLDFAGKKGSDVIAVGIGVVTKVARDPGFGKLIEINHGNGYVTRYGHNEAVLVKEGERVDQGQTIAKMGSSGRSTGPHLHFEVLLYGEQVNPATYVYASR